MTATTVSIGFRYTTNAEAFDDMGFAGLTTGDGRAEAQAVVEYVNSHGGLAGRRVVPLFYAQDTAKAVADRNGNEQATCSYFTEDHRAFAVVSGQLGFTENMMVCLSKAGVTVVSNYNGVDAAFDRRIRGFYYLPSDFQMERLYRTYVTGLIGDGFVTRSSKVGVYYTTDAPVAQRILDGTVKPLLARHGIALAAAAGASFTNGADWQNAVLKFKTAGVDRVLGIYETPLMFMNAAESQQYHPRYGLHSGWGPGALLQTAAPPAQLAGAVGVGWQPYSDVDAARNPGPVSDTEALCRRIMADAGQASTDPTTVLFQLQTCDVVFFLQRAFSRTRTVTPSELSAAVAALGDDHRSPVTFRSRFPGGRPDGAAAYRISRYVDACSCFTYTGATHPL